jgi:hypothetical protein
MSVLSSAHLTLTLFQKFPVRLLALRFIWDQCHRPAPRTWQPYDDVYWGTKEQNVKRHDAFYWLPCMYWSFWQWKQNEIMEAICIHTLDLKYVDAPTVSYFTQCRIIAANSRIIIQFIDTVAGTQRKHIRKSKWFRDGYSLQGYLQLYISELNGSLGTCRVITCAVSTENLLGTNSGVFESDLLLHSI